ncbi:MAG: ribosome maturation factor RimM [Bacilli bacterium]
MGDYLLVGRIVSTHGIKGELKVISEFTFIDKVFIKNFSFYVSEEFLKETIKSVRPHKQYQLVLFNGFEDINLVDKFIGKNVYIKKSDLVLSESEYLIDDLMDATVMDKDEVIGKVTEILKSKKNDFVRVSGKKVFLIPLIDEYIEKFDKVNMVLYTIDGKNLIL